ncbi:IQ domain-containing protein E isoform X5 [Otolemur garnettii]|uniref:IQ domain-containing protein E isoform X5 n=1 Tax=Otolemur garnettii TaxID=30611 RepID=UPI000C7F2608|nr:IQ domain-containing protein E isoform X5 [Otolemur garnettii]
MSLGTGEPASETGDDSLSAITFDSDFETKTKRKSFHKPPPTSPKSPYHSKPRKVASWRSLRTAGSMPLGGRVSLTPQKLWLGTSKPGSLTQPLKSNLTLEHTWTKPPSSTPDYLTEALRMKRSDLRHSASNGHVPGIPVYREKEDMYDEIIELKKVINGLKQRILKLEQQCKEKDTTINKLQTDMKTTNLEEMRIAMETYYEEIHRLQTLLASCDTTGKKPPGEKKMSARRQKKVNSALLNLSRSVQELTEENQSLKEDLDRVLSNSPTVSKVKAGYTEWSKPRLLRRISELEKKISSVESLKLRPSELAKSSPLAHSSSSSTVNRQLRGDRDCREEQERLRGCCGEEQERLRGCREEQERLQEEQERLRGTLRSLKGERDALQAQLLERGLEVKQLLQIKADLEKELENMREWEKERRKQEEALKEEVQTLTNKFQELREMEKEEKDDPMEVTHETQEEQASAPSSRYSEQDLDTDFCGGWLLHSHPPSTERRRDIAARTLQAQWKVYKHKKKKAILDEAAMVLQAAFKGHLARVKLLASKACDSEPPSTPSLPNQPQSSPTPCILSPIAQTEGNPGQEEAITVIQSVLRAHLAQANHSTTSKRTTTAAGAKRRPTSATHKETSSPPILAASPGKEDSEASSGEAVEDEDRLGESAAPGPCSAAPFLSRPLVPPPVDDVNSDDSDDVVIAPPLPMRKSSSPV